MSNPLLSIETANQQAVNRGALYQSYHGYTALTSLATVNCGSVSMQRMPQVFTNYASVDDSVVYDFFAGSSLSSINISANIEYDLGTLTVSGNSFSDGVSAPTKTPPGGTSGLCIFTSVVLAVTTALSATAPVVTITYTDQDGNTGNTAALTLPTNCNANSAFRVYPHLASGDIGIRDITNVSISTGTAGVIKVMGLLELADIAISSTSFGLNDPRITAYPLYPIAAGETIALYTQNTVSTISIYADWVMVPIT